jgi:putative ABC transport system permease protein
MIAKLTWRNLWRNRRRTLITMASVTFAVFLAVLMQSFQKGIFDNLVKNVVSFYYGYIQVHKKGYWDEKIIDNGFVINDSQYNRLKQVSHVTEIVPRLETFVLASAGNTTKGCMLIGTDAERENRMTALEEKITGGSYFTNEEKKAIIAEGLAERLNIGVNDTVVILGQGYQGTLAAGKYHVKAVVHFGSPELNNNAIYLPLPVAQELLNADNLITSLAVAIDDPGQMNAIQSEMRKNTSSEFEIMNWEEMMPEISNHIKADGSSFHVFNGILYLIIAFGIFGTVLMMTTERRYEFGMLIAIGMKKMRLSAMLLAETIMITLLGVALGLLISFPIIVYFNKKPIRIHGDMAQIYERFGFEALFPTTVNPQAFFTQSVIVLVIAFIVGLYPLWHIHKLNPVTAMKK